MNVALTSDLVGVRTITLHGAVNSSVSASHLAAIVKRRRVAVCKAKLSVFLAKSFIDGPISFPNV